MRIKVYIGAFAAALAAILVYTLADGEGFGRRVPDWLFLITLYAATEYVVTRFHHHAGSIGLSTAEAIFLPMVVGLTFAETVWGITLGAAIAVVATRTMAPTKALFNVAQFGLSAAAGAAVWDALSRPSAGLSLRNALVAALCAVVFAAITHVSVAGAIAISEGAPLSALSVAAGRETVLNLAWNIALGLLFATSYLGARWTVVLFPLPLIALFIGYRAFLRQAGERQRVEHLHEASRALAAGHDLKHALEGFLRSVAELASAGEARAVLDMGSRIVWSGVRDGELVATMDPVSGGPMLELLDALRRGSGPIVRRTEDASSELERLGSSFVAVPLLEGSHVSGALVVVGRVGADEFDDSDARLLESLANELVLTLDSYRLFAQVNEERERFRRIFASSREGICLLDARGAVHAWNPALERISGYSADDVMGRVWSERVLVRDRDQRRLEGVDLVRLPEETEVELVTKDGPTRWIMSLASPVMQSEGGGWVVLVRDVSAEHQAEEAKSDFLSTMSHELRTPLTTIKGSLDVLKRGPQKIPAETFDQMMGVMSRGAERLERLVMNLLIVSQIESGSLAVFADEVDLESLVRLRIGTIVPDREVDLTVSGENLVVRGDQERLAQTVDHLLDNARKYGGQDGRITVELRRENGYVVLSVGDEGPGVPPAERERIFERFVRLGNVLTRETQGAGVGLFIAKRSVEAMGGRIWVEPGPSGGSTFHVCMPVAHPVALSEPAS